MTEHQKELDEDQRELIQHVMQQRRQELQVRGGGPQSLAGSLREVIAARKIGRVMESRELSLLWKNCVDEAIEPNTRVVSLRNRVLLVEVSDSVLMSELSNFHRRPILAALKKARPDMQITNLKFRLNAGLSRARE